MFRSFRHRLIVLLLAATLCGTGIALTVQPMAWPAIAICTGCAALGAVMCGRIARRYLHATLGRLRRVADDVSAGRAVEVLEVEPGHDMYKLNAAINQLAARLLDARQQEQRLNEALRRRERLAYLGELAATVAHEVNNPLDGVQNCARILRRSLDDPRRATQMLDLIDGGLARIELIVRRLLTLAREQVVRPAPASLGEVIESALASVQAKLDSRRVCVRRQNDARDDTVAIDRPLMEQVFVNLLLNAADSMPEGGGEIAIAIRKECDALGVSVVDNGAGIAPEILPHIFEPFFTTKPGGKGTGLGLAIAARIIDAHQGSIAVAPHEGGGTVFTIRLPVIPVVA